jgi:general stress protein 26
MSSEQREVVLMSTSAVETTELVHDRWASYQQIVDWVDICMLLTHTADGRFASRWMATQPYAGGEVICLVTDVGSRKADEIRANPLVNVAFYNDSSREWLSVSGRARVTQDTGRIAQLYSPKWKTWFPALDARRDGSMRDPRLALIEIRIEHVTYFKGNGGASMEIASNFVGAPSAARDLALVDARDRQ